jgi:hypothetical protein
VGILLTSDTFLPLIEGKVGKRCDVQVGNWTEANMNANVVLVDGAPSRPAFDVATRSGARMLLSTARTRSRGVSTGGWWQVTRERISHSLVGGITTRVVDFTVHQPTDAATLVTRGAIPAAVPRDASTVLSLAQHAKIFRPAPTLEVIDPLRCVNLASNDKPIYHGRGLLPSRLTRDTWVLTPFLFSPKVKKEWGLRRLGVQETLMCLDFPDDWVTWLAKAGADCTFVENQAPMACFVAGARRWLAALFPDNEGVEVGAIKER